MNKSIVLNEALSIPKRINNFTQTDKNNYDEIAKLIAEKKNSIYCYCCKRHF